MSDDDVLNKISHLQAAIRQLADQGEIKPETKEKLFDHLGHREDGESASTDEGLLTAITYLKDGAIGRYRKAPNVVLEDGDEFVLRNGYEERIESIAYDLRKIEGKARRGKKEKAPQTREQAIEEAADELEKLSEQLLKEARTSSE
ncbi:hypothetical protein [Haloferax sp. Q22]|uniref:hypothetical protein n=1 Tax=Haloferax sp. (strain Q22) TaxID=1526048 RepID=UPI000AF08760|nr:hypothetical protein [Haloferax sp. Q22]